MHAFMVCKRCAQCVCAHLPESSLDSLPESSAVRRVLESAAFCALAALAGALRAATCVSDVTLTAGGAFRTAMAALPRHGGATLAGAALVPGRRMLSSAPHVEIEAGAEVEGAPASTASVTSSASTTSTS